MEVIICSKNNALRTKLTMITDRLLSQRHIRTLSLYPDTVQVPEKLLNNLRTGRGYLIILDIESYPNWKEIIILAARENKLAKFCILSDKADAAVDIINQFLSNVCGYIKKIAKNLRETFEEFLITVYGKARTVCGGIMVQALNGAYTIIPFKDIFFIETIKQTHLCTIIHKNGKNIIRADIKKLIYELDERFAITRASAIANLSAVSAFDKEALYYSGNVCCPVAKSRATQIKGILCQQGIF